MLDHRVLDNRVTYCKLHTNLCPVGIVNEKSYIWLQTADGLTQQVEQDVALFCPFIRHTMQTSSGSSKKRPPVALPETELKYFNEKFIRVHRESLTELLTSAKSLQMTELVDLICRPFVKLIETSTDEEIRQVFDLPDDMTEEDKWTPIQINTDNSEV
ncbi:SKP1-like protein 21 [Tanacetum coccineum]